MTEFVSQWDRLIKNLGTWKGSFTRFSPSGAFIEDTPSIVSLEGIDNNQTVRQVLRFFSSTDGSLQRERELVYSSLSRSVLFFDGGAFCWGSLQLSPFADFASEFGFIAANRRLRLVQMYNSDHHLDQVTLIREALEDQPAAESPPLDLESLTGVWQGEATTIYPDFSERTVSTRLTVERHGEQIVQHLQSEGVDLRSSGQIEGNRLRFDTGTQPVQVLLLPGGASCTGPLVHEWAKPVFLEAGWLIEPNLRQRMIRSFNAKGEWTALTLVSERRVG
ncbi:DUF3598 family protein [Gloeobacter kilaueensis]|uniref:Uncharacterized protein n=1 Tax=Gloeobacter kilaueensis (strain ATCC BAA-2537 / CCAP 1431/1 / ULC 316 / JS1) TaxID=1183438 RepID=U5QLY2_GLOK1|nr:DUF3598 family protein [Gloeobacter kilaueensis]AGY58624.1 hypothetical protein GKIL_2378 [Gloeobacter kilaueensis JS1]